MDIKTKFKEVKVIIELNENELGVLDLMLHYYPASLTDGEKSMTHMEKEIRDRIKKLSEDLDTTIY